MTSQQAIAAEAEAHAGKRGLRLQCRQQIEHPQTRGANRVEQRQVVGKHRHQAIAVANDAVLFADPLALILRDQLNEAVVIQSLQWLLTEQFMQAGHVAQRQVEALPGDRVQRIGGITDEDATPEAERVRTGTLQGDRKSRPDRVDQP